MKRSEIQTLQARFENYVSLTATQGTAVRYAKALSAFFDRFGDRRSPDEFTRVDFEDYIIYRRREGINPRTINYEMTIVKCFWNWLMRQELASYNPGRTVKRLREMEPKKAVLTEDEQVRLYEVAAQSKRPKDLLLVSLVLSTGLRAQSLFLLEKKDIDFETKLIRLPADKMKAGRNHELPLRDDVAELIKLVPEERLFDNYASSAASLSYRFNCILRRSGIALRGLRLGRRSFATTLIRKGTDLKTVQDLLGHSNIATTSRYIIKGDQERSRAAIASLPMPEVSHEHDESVSNSNEPLSGEL